MISELKPYPDYKDTGLWVGCLPRHWETRRAKYFLREIDERSRTGKETLLSVSHLTGVTPRSEKTVSMFLAKTNVGHKICRPDDVVINTLWAWMAALGVSRHQGIVSPAYGVYRPLPGSALLPQFTDYLLRTPLYAAEYRRRSTGIRSSRMRLYPEEFLRIPLICPPREEQAAILRFLYWADDRLARVIRSKRRVIALLNEQKRLIIRRAVTEGLGPSVPLKPSGVPWLGDVPHHWHVTRVKNECYCLNTERVPLNAVQRGEMTLRLYDYYGASGVIDKVDDYLFDGELLLIAEDGANLLLRNLPLAIIAKGKFWVNNHAHILKPKRSNIVYLAHLLESLNFAPWISGAAQPKLTKDRLLSISIAVPPPYEQDAIVEHTTRHTAPLTRTRSRLQREIDLVQEYRARLIADIVTGQMDVREASARLPDQAVPAANDDSAEIGAEPESDDEEIAV
jgi:type I restriction enzyme S subunit